MYSNEIYFTKPFKALSALMDYRLRTSNGIATTHKTSGLLSLRRVTQHVQSLTLHLQELLLGSVLTHRESQERWKVYQSIKSWHYAYFTTKQE